MGQIGEDDIKNRFGFHPATEQTKAQHQIVRSAFIELAAMLDELLPPGRESALVMTKLQEAAMWANASVACNLAPLVLGS